ncbi:MAG: site-2 protease family protein [Pseudomonadota bacterium]
MTWSYRIATIQGTAVRVHLTFLALLAWIGWVSWQRGGAEAATDGILFLLLVFLCVLLHEGGHAWAANRYGIRTPEITLLPIGGLARLERMPESPGRELAVAAAGPMVNLVIAGALLLVLGVRIQSGDLASLERIEGSMAARLAVVNLMLVAFNLLPAFPLDGGRMLRALLALRFGRGRATLIAGRVGQLFGLGFVGIGFVHSPLLMLIGIFVIFAADLELRQEAARGRAGTHLVADIAVRRFATLAPEDPLRRAGQAVLATTQDHFPVLSADGHAVGVLTRARLVEGLRQAGPQAPVLEHMHRDLPRVALEDTVDALGDTLHRHEARAALVHGPDGALVGYVTLEALAVALLAQRGSSARP